jgi:hypothetical protein
VDVDADICTRFSTLWMDAETRMDGSKSNRFFYKKRPRTAVRRTLSRRFDFDPRSGEVLRRDFVLRLDKVLAVRCGVPADGGLCPGGAVQNILGLLIKKGNLFII